MNAVALIVSSVLGTSVPAYDGPIVPPYSGEIKLEPAPVHTAKPTVRPKKLTHTYRHWGSCGCTMCLGQHLRNAHGEASRALDELGYRNWRSYHSKLHGRGKATAAAPGAPGPTTVRRAPTFCTPQPCRPRILGLLRGG
jgi:hypothetical protein